MTVPLSRRTESRYRTLCAMADASSDLSDREFNADWGASAMLDVAVSEIVAYLRAGTYPNPATGRDRAIPGWKNAAEYIEREFGGQDGA